MNGFMLNGRHCERDMKLHYIPSEKERAGYPAGWDVEMTDDTTKDGSVFYSRRQKAKQFVIKCFYEEQTEAELRRIERWLDESGDLIFDDLDFCKWFVVPNDMPVITKYPVRVKNEKRWSGTIEIHLTAPDPNASFINKQTASGTMAYDITGQIQSNKIPNDPTTDSTFFYVYNPGNVKCGLTLQVAGDSGSGGITFTNMTNGQECKIVNMTKATTSNVLKWVEVEGKTMRTLLKGAATQQYGYSFHDDGYIWLEPCGIQEKEIKVELRDGYIVSPDRLFRKSMEGQYIYLRNQWREILTVVDAGRIRTGDTFDTWRLGEMVLGSTTDVLGGDELQDEGTNALIVTQNKIQVRRGTGASLTKLAVSYEPKIRIR